MSLGLLYLIDLDFSDATQHYMYFINAKYLPMSRVYVQNSDSTISCMPDRVIPSRGRTMNKAL